MKNEGQINPRAVLETGVSGSFSYAAADVRKPLMAVSACNAKGNACWFDGQDSHILPKTCPQLAKIRKLIAEASGKIPVHFENGVYCLHTWVEPDECPFQGQGR